MAKIINLNEYRKNKKEPYGFRHISTYSDEDLCSQIGLMIAETLAAEWDARLNALFPGSEESR